MTITQQECKEIREKLHRLNQEHGAEFQEACKNWLNKNATPLEETFFEVVRQAQEVGTLHYAALGNQEISTFWAVTPGFKEVVGNLFGIHDPETFDEEDESEESNGSVIFEIHGLTIWSRSTFGQYAYMDGEVQAAVAYLMTAGRLPDLEEA